MKYFAVSGIAFKGELNQNEMTSLKIDDLLASNVLNVFGQNICAEDKQVLTVFRRHADSKIDSIFINRLTRFDYKG